MKLSEGTINILKSFAVINTGIEFKPGNILQTISPQKSIMAKAEIEDTLPAHGCFYELNRFLGVLSLFDQPQLDPSGIVLASPQARSGLPSSPQESSTGSSPHRGQASSRGQRPG